MSPCIPQCLGHSRTTTQGRSWKQDSACSCLDSPILTLCGAVNNNTTINHPGIALRAPFTDYGKQHAEGNKSFFMQTLRNGMLENHS